jgi:hypothetical protein
LEEVDLGRVREAVRPEIDADNDVGIVPGGRCQIEGAGVVGAVTGWQWGEGLECCFDGGRIPADCHDVEPDIDIV